MCYYIQIEDLAANAMIEMLENDQFANRQEISFKKLNQYGKKVVEYLNKEKHDAIVIISRESTNQFKYKYKNYFTVRDDSEGTFISVGENITADKLRKDFRARLSIDLVCAFSNDQSVRALMD